MRHGKRKFLNIFALRKLNATQRMHVPLRHIYEPDFTVSLCITAIHMYSLNIIMLTQL